MTVSVSLAKRARKAIQCNQVPVATTQALVESLIEGSNPVSGQDPVSQKLETIMTMLIDLMRRIRATENHVREKVTTSPISHYFLGQPTDGPCSSSVPLQEPDLSKAVRERVAKRLQQLPMMGTTTTDRDSSVKEEHPAQQHRHS